MGRRHSLRQVRPQKALLPRTEVNTWASEASEDNAMEDARRRTRRRPTSPGTSNDRVVSRGGANPCPSHHTRQLIRPRSLFVGGPMWGFRRVANGQASSEKKGKSMEDARRRTRRRPTSPGTSNDRVVSRGGANPCPSHHTRQLIRPLFVGGPMWGFRRVANGQASSERKGNSIRRMRRLQGPPPTNGGEHMGRAKKQAEKDDRTHPRPLSDATRTVSDIRTLCFGPKRLQA
jgi:hypothetical protein